MRTQRRFGLAILALGVLVLLAGTTQAGLLPGQPTPPDPFTINFDENGNATISENGGLPFTENGFLAPDESGAFTGVNVLTYQLPEPVGPGGLNVLDASGAISDNLFFYNSETNGFMEFLSQVGGGQLADTGVTDFGFNAATEAADGTFVYSVGNVYTGVSPEVAPIPEPSSLALFGLGGLALAAWRRRHRA